MFAVMPSAKRITPLAVPHLRARRLRHEQTDAEALLWRHLRDARLNGFKFRRQFPIDKFIADFCCLRSKLVIELDGEQHAEQATRDALRSEALARRGYRVLRFWNDEALTNMDGVLEVILQTLNPSP
jgi:very-short-patch-repair endonuclease